MVAWSQTNLLHAAQTALASIAADVHAGLQQTVGATAEWVSEINENDPRASIAIGGLPTDADVEMIARAVDLENVEAWLDEDSRVRIGISLWMTTNDIDQIVLAVTKVLHVKYGMHAAHIEPHQHPHGE